MSPGVSIERYWFPKKWPGPDGTAVYNFHTILGPWTAAPDGVTVGENGIHEGPILCFSMERIMDVTDFARTWRFFWNIGEI